MCKTFMPVSSYACKVYLPCLLYPMCRWNETKLSFGVIDLHIIGKGFPAESRKFNAFALVCTLIKYGNTIFAQLMQSVVACNASHITSAQGLPCLACRASPDAKQADADLREFSISWSIYQREISPPMNGRQYQRATHCGLFGHIRYRLSSAPHFR